MLDELRKALGRATYMLTPVPRGGGVFELRGEIPAGWVTIRVEVRGGRDVKAPIRLFDGYATHFLSPGRRGRAEAVVQVLPGAALEIAVPDGAELDPSRIMARGLARTEAALRRAAPIVWRRLREPATIPSAAFKLLRAALSGELLDRLLQRGGTDAAQTFYPEWYARYASLTQNDRRAILSAIEKLPRRPVFSVLMPIHDPSQPWLDRAIASVRAQLYADWELCIAGGASRSPQVRRILQQAASEDSRIRVVIREDQGEISSASNSALAAASGEFSLLLHQDDELTEHALYLLAHELSQNPEADLVYADEDKIDERGRVREPSFKPDWNPDLLLSQNYLARLCAIRTTFVRETGAFRQGYEGNQDYDLALRVSARSTPERLRHVPWVLYHSRSFRSSGAQSTSTDSRAQDSGLRALRDHLTTHAPGATADAGPLPNTYRVRWPLPAAPPLITLIVPTRDGKSVLEPCIESLLSKTRYRRFQLIIVDNGSRDPSTLQYLAGLETRDVARVVRFDRPFNFSAINNFAVREHGRGELVGLLNDDVEAIEDDWLDEMVSQAIRPEIGAVGARLLYPDGTLQHGGILLGISGAAGYEHKFLPRGTPGYLGRAELAHDVSAVTAACLVIRRDTWLRVGGFDESFAVALNDVDFCLRVRALGLRNLWTPFATLVHHESKSRGYEDTPEKKARFEQERRRLKERWGDTLLDDPAYNPNLSLDAEDFSLAWPPRVRKPWQ